jgi:regulator of nonsense transcripts 3
LFISISSSFGQQYAFSRAYLNILNRQDLIVFTEKFQAYVFVDKNGDFSFNFLVYYLLFNLGNEYPCSVEYAPNQSRPKSEQQSRKDPKMNSIEHGKTKLN